MGYRHVYAYMNMQCRSVLVMHMLKVFYIDLHIDIYRDIYRIYICIYTYVYRYMCIYVHMSAVY